MPPATTVHDRCQTLSSNPFIRYLRYCDKALDSHPRLSLDPESSTIPRSLRQWMRDVSGMAEPWHESALLAVKGLIFVYSIVALLQVLASTYARQPELPKPATTARSAKRIKLGIPLAPCVTFHLSMKVKGKGRLLKVGCSVGVVKAMAVLDMGEGWRSSIRGQMKLYGLLAFVKSSTTVQGKGGKADK